MCVELSFNLFLKMFINEYASPTPCISPKPYMRLLVVWLVRDVTRWEGEWSTCASMHQQYQYNITIHIHVSTGCMLTMPVTITANYTITDSNSHTVDAQSRLSCTSQCQKLKNCFVYSFKKGTGECVLTTSPPESRYVVSSPGWETYKICPRHVAGCHAGIH